ncbi:hypothetical protein [Demequina gelatinilytica]|uniref:hypothetical protein n=1 Tax=Demequina gelatinilytica TaxID=1638980 RepID=UPI000780B631|nr:hypothetical protein [Demequina gelatinilytica]
MTTADSPESRKVLVAFAQAKWDAMDRARKREVSGRPGVAILVVDGESRMDPAVAKRVLADFTVTDGAVLVQNPYDTSRYFLEEDAAVEIALEKTLCIAEVCHLIGARRFNVTSVQNDTDGTQWSADAGGGSKRVLGKFSGTGGKTKQLARRITLSDKSSGGIPDIQAARDYLAQHNLESDSMLRSLVDMVAFENNQIQERALTVDVTREAKSTLKLALEVKAADYGSGKATGGGTKSAVDQLTVKYEISF